MKRYKLIVRDLGLIVAMIAITILVVGGAGFMVYAAL